MPWASVRECPLSECGLGGRNGHDLSVTSNLNKREQRRLRRAERATERGSGPRCTMCGSPGGGRVVVTAGGDLYLCEECIDALAAFVGECRADRDRREKD
jgi:hypothetical protein